MNPYEDPTIKLHSHNWSEEYKNNYDKIFGKKETWLERRDREAACDNSNCLCTSSCKQLELSLEFKSS